MGRNPFANKPTQPLSLPEQERAVSPFAPFPAGENTPPSPPSTEAGSIRSHIENIPAANFQTKKREDKRTRTQSRFLQLTESNHKRMIQLVQKNEVPQHEIIRFALEHALQRYQTGALSLNPVLAGGGLTLFPGQVQKQRQRRQKLINISVRHLPDEVWETIKNLLEIVPLWQVINRLLADAFTEIEEGKITLQPQVSGLYTLYPNN